MESDPTMPMSPKMTPSRSVGRRHRKSIVLSAKAPKTPKDVRQLDRDQMIEFLQEYDDEVPENVEQMMRAPLQKRVIQCMKQQQGRTVSSPYPVSQPLQWPLSANPSQRVSRKRKAEMPLTGAIHKRMKRNVAQCKQEPLPIKALHATPPSDTKEQEQDPEQHADVDPDTLFKLLHFDLADRPCDSVVQRLLAAVKKGLPARYDIVPLSHDVMNLDAATSYVRSSKMQKMFEVCHAPGQRGRAHGVRAGERRRLSADQARDRADRK